MFYSEKGEKNSFPHFPHNCAQFIRQTRNIMLHRIRHNSCCSICVIYIIQIKLCVMCSTCCDHCQDSMTTSKPLVTIVAIFFNIEMFFLYVHDQTRQYPSMCERYNLICANPIVRYRQLNSHITELLGAWTFFPILLHLNHFRFIF